MEERTKWIIALVMFMAAVAKPRNIFLTKRLGFGYLLIKNAQNERIRIEKEEH